ncbi:MAG: phosphatidylserine decarboxylase [Eubacterium sp.]|nr:phosphatidylserine decarboxylase [Eubacterium sp.]
MEKNYTENLIKIEPDSKSLRFLYHTAPGRILLKLLIRPGLSKLVGKYMDTGLSKIHIKGFIKNAGIDMSEYEDEKYTCFNDCFTRKVKPEKRPVFGEEGALISPCDAKLSAYHITEDSQFAIKHSTYRVQDLIEGSEKAPDYRGGTCLIFRLCVDNYHRYGHVDDGEILENKPLSGKLHTVRPIAIGQYPIFIQNAREYTVMQTKHFGIVTQIEVGAMMIGKIKNHQTTGAVKKGEEKGMFLYGGSTIVLLLEKGVGNIPEECFKATEEDYEIPVKYGQKL